MNTRRNFFRSLAALAGAASISPQIFIPKFEPVRWKVAALDLPFSRVHRDVVICDPNAPPPYLYVWGVKEWRFWETPSQYPALV